jgi:hypothetical protein
MEKGVSDDRKISKCESSGLMRVKMRVKMRA